MLRVNALLCRAAKLVALLFLVKSLFFADDTATATLYVAWACFAMLLAASFAVDHG